MISGLPILSNNQANFQFKDDSDAVNLYIFSSGQSALFNFNSYPHGQASLSLKENGLLVLVRRARIGGLSDNDLSKTSQMPVLDSIELSPCMNKLRNRCSSAEERTS